VLPTCWARIGTLCQKRYLGLHRFRHDKEALSPGLVTLDVESGIVQHIQNAEVVGRPEIGVIFGERGSLIVAGRRDIAAEIVLRVRLDEKRPAAPCRILCNARIISGRW
jgi:hypothetical protein